MNIVEMLLIAAAKERIFRGIRPDPHRQNDIKEYNAAMAVVYHGNDCASCGKVLSDAEGYSHMGESLTCSRCFHERWGVKTPLRRG